MALTTRQEKLSVLDWDGAGVAEGITTTGDKQHLVNSPSVPVWTALPVVATKDNYRLSLAIGLGL